MKTAAIIALAAAALAAAVTVAVHIVREAVRPQEPVRREDTPRGRILDRNGCVLAQSATVYDIHLDCTVIQDEERWNAAVFDLAPKLAEVLPQRSEDEWRYCIHEGRIRGKKYLAVAKGVSEETRDAVARLPLFNMGTFAGGGIITPREVRVHPYGDLARRTLGYVRPGINMVGLEGRYDAVLQQGSDLHTTLDMGVQAVADSILRVAVGGEGEIEAACLVLMEVSTGDILAMVNLSRDYRKEEPSFDELYNHAIGHAYEPGEVIRTMAQALLLQDVRQGSPDRDMPASGGSAEEFAARLSRLCLPRDLEFDLEGLWKAEIPFREEGDSSGVSIPSLAGGQDLLMAPLDILSFYNTVANRGTMVRPRLVRSVGEGPERGPVLLEEGILEPAVCDTLTHSLLAVSRTGTGRRPKDARCTVAGKTGTTFGENARRRYPAGTFVGFFPAESPRYSVICAVFGPYGGRRTYDGGDLPAKTVSRMIDNLEL